jgi:hypothetical protein
MTTSALVLAILLTSIPFALVSGAILTLVACIIYRIWIWPFHRTHLYNVAVQRGHVVEAHLVKSNEIYGNDTVNANATLGKYRYEWNGKTYYRRCTTTGKIPDQVTLYFVKHPGKATFSDAVGLHERRWPKFFAVFFLLCMVVAFVYLWMWSTTLILM